MKTVNLKTDNNQGVGVDQSKFKIETAERKDIKELFDDFDGEYVPIAVDWGQPSGKEVW